MAFSEYTAEIFFFILLERFEYIPLCNISFMKCYLVSVVFFLLFLFVCLFVKSISVSL